MSNDSQNGGLEDFKNNSDGIDYGIKPFLLEIFWWIKLKSKSSIWA